MRNFSGRVVELALSLLTAAWLISLALSIIRPLAPVLAVTALLGLLALFGLRRARGY